MTTGQKARTILVAGGGIAGLTAALSFARHGFNVRVFERAPSFHEIGAGLQLSPNATRLLDRLGVLGALLPHATRPRQVVLRRAASLAELARVPLGEDGEQRWKAPYLVLHRADLLGALLDRARESDRIEINTDARARDIEPGHAGPALVLDRNGTEQRVRGDLVVGADGVWSSLRAAVGAAQAAFSGRIAWRATLDATDAAVKEMNLAPDEVTAFVHPRAHLIAYPIRQGRSINLAGFAKGAVGDRAWAEGRDPAGLANALAGSDPRLSRLIANAAPWTVWPVTTVEPSAPWTRDGLALIGDAAHAMTPFAAQGAAAAIEDAYVLAGCIAGNPGDIAAALRRYETVRRARVARLAGRGRFNELAWHARGPIAFGRDMVLKLRSPQALMADFDWLYGWDGDAAMEAAG